MKQSHIPILYLYISEGQMNQKTLQNIYKEYQTEEFYRRYLVQLGCREDRRTINQQRPIKVTARNNSIVLSCGQTTIITHVQASIEQVTFSPISNSYGQPLLKLNVSGSGSQTKYRENKEDKAIEQFINKQINWSVVQDQLAGSDLVTGKQYAYKGEISLRVLGNDGSIQQYGLLAVQLLLQSCKFKKFRVNKENITFQEDYQLKILNFIYPIKYCEIINELIIDPSLSEEQNSRLSFTILKDLKQYDRPQTVIQRARRNVSQISDQTVKKILNRWQHDFSKIKSNFQNTYINVLLKTGECVIE